MAQAMAAMSASPHTPSWSSHTAPRRSELPPIREAIPQILSAVHHEQLDRPSHYSRQSSYSSMSLGNLPPPPSYPSPPESKARIELGPAKDSRSRPPDLSLSRTSSSRGRLEFPEAQERSPLSPVSRIPPATRSVWKGESYRGESSERPVIPSIFGNDLGDLPSSTLPPREGVQYSPPQYQYATRYSTSQESAHASEVSQLMTREHLSQPLYLPYPSSRPPPSFSPSAYGGANGQSAGPRPPYAVLPDPVGEYHGDHGMKRRRGNLPRHVTDLLKSWFKDHLSHPYPSEEEKQMLMCQTGLTITQLSNWFINARRRHLPQIDRQAKAEAMAHQHGQGHGRLDSDEDTEVR